MKIFKKYTVSTDYPETNADTTTRSANFAKKNSKSLNFQVNHNFKTILNQFCSQSHCTEEASLIFSADKI